MGLLSWLQSVFAPSPPPPPDALSAALLADVEAGISATFAADSTFTNMLRCTVTNASGQAAFAVCPDRVPNAASAALKGAIALLSKEAPTVTEGATGTTTTFTVFPTQAYAAGTYTSGSVNFNGSPTMVGYQIASTTWQTDNPAVQVAIVAQQSFDNGATWQEAFGFTTSPGPIDNIQGQPIPGATPSGAQPVNDTLGPRLVRAQMTLTGGGLTLGLTGSTTPLS